tara:strand:- start:167 stop:1609 length:1443 start_codon:yes stop_codon:yes gene_type:complete
MRYNEIKLVETRVLAEGQGLRAAAPGEIYVDRDGTEYSFVVWDFKYPNDADRFETPEEVNAAVEEITRTNPKADIRWINQPGRGRAFGFAKFQAEDKREIWLGKYFQKVNPTNTIKDGEATAVSLSPSKGSAATKASVNMQPGQLGVADGKTRSVQGIIAEINNHEMSDMLTRATQEAAKNEPIVFVAGAQYASAIQDDFCEVLAPVALIGRHSVVNGPMDQAVADIFKGGDLKGAGVMFPEGQNNPLIDAYIIKDGIEMGISHKGKQGAKASITNIWKSKEEAAKTQTGQAYIAKFANAVEILDICKEQGQAIQPITLAEKFNLISAQESAKLKELMQNPMAEELKLVGNPQAPKAVVRQATPEDLQKVPNELKRIFTLGGYKPGSYVSYLCLARIAAIVAQHINTDPEIDFGEAIRSFLNSSAMVQAKTIVGAQGEDAVVKSITVVYPPNFQEKAKIESNAYYGTGIKSKFSFSLPKT